MAATATLFTIKTPLILSEPPTAQQQNAPLRITVPNLSDKLNQRRVNQQQSVKQSLALITDSLAKNAAEIKAERILNHETLKRKKIQENLEHRLSMVQQFFSLYHLTNLAIIISQKSDGRPKHNGEFRKANRALETFKDQLFLLPTIEEARVYKQQDAQLALKKITQLKQKSLYGSSEVAWNQTRHYGGYFDSMHQMKPAAMSMTSLDSLTSPSQSIRNGSQMSLGMSNPNRASSSQIQITHGEIEQSNEHNLLNRSQIGFKPTSANNLILLQQQINEEKRSHQTTSQSSLKKIHLGGGATAAPASGTTMSKASKSMSSLNSLPEVSMSTTSGGNKVQWVNAYHENEMFGRLSCDNLDIKLQSAARNRIPQPFSPPKVYGDHFNKYISLGIAEREFRSNKPMEVPTNLTNEPFLIGQQQSQQQMRNSSKKI